MMTVMMIIFAPQKSENVWMMRNTNRIWTSHPGVVTNQRETKQNSDFYGSKSNTVWGEILFYPSLQILNSCPPFQNTQTTPHCSCMQRMVWWIPTFQSYSYLPLHRARECFAEQWNQKHCGLCIVGKTILNGDWHGREVSWQPEYYNTCPGLHIWVLSS